MTSSLAVAAPPIVALLLLLLWLDRHAGRSGLLMLVSVLWGGLAATGLVTLVGSLWVEQPEAYPYLVAPAVEELAKASLFLVLVPLGLVSGAPTGVVYGLACGLGFALWENAAYFEGYAGSGPPPLLYVSRTAGAALLHAVSTAAVGAAAGVGGPGLARLRRGLALAGALAAAFSAHAAWNYGCLVLADTSAMRRALPASGAAMLVVLLVHWVRRERTLLRVEVLRLWQDGVVDEPLARAVVGRKPARVLRAAGFASPARLLAAVLRLATARRVLAATPAARRRSRARAEAAVASLSATVEALVAGWSPPLDRSRRAQVLLAAAFLATAALLSVVGRASPVPSALARRTIVVTSGETVRPDPLITVADSGVYLLWQRAAGPSGQRRQQVLTWIGPGPDRLEAMAIGLLPEDQETWYDMTALGPGVVVGTRDEAQIHLRSFREGAQTGEARVRAPEVQPGVPCWPWLASDQGRTLVAWDRLSRAAWLTTAPLGAAEAFDLPDPFDGADVGESGCFRGLLVTDETAYEVARPGGRALMAAVDLEGRRASPLALCPSRPDLRVHSLDKDSGAVLVLLGGPEEPGAPASSPYGLWLARLDRAGRLLERCRRIRTLPTGEPSVVSLAGAGESAFIAWATSSHVLLARIPLDPRRSPRERRWVLDRAPPGGPGVVRLGVVDQRLHVTWEAPSPGRRYAVKLLRTEIDDLP